MTKPKGYLSSMWPTWENRNVSQLSHTGEVQHQDGMYGKGSDWLERVSVGVLIGPDLAERRCLTMLATLTTRTTCLPQPKHGERAKGISSKMQLRLRFQEQCHQTFRPKLVGSISDVQHFDFKRKIHLKNNRVFTFYTLALTPIRMLSSDPPFFHTLDT